MSLLRAEGISAAEMAFRWAVHNSVLDGSRRDAVIIGPRTTEQTRAALDGIQNGSLSTEGQAKIDALLVPLQSQAEMNTLEAISSISGCQVS